MNFNRLFGVMTIAVVITGIVLAFIYLGTPAHQRLVSLDEKRVRDLETIASSLNARYQSTPLPSRLPGDLVILDDGHNQSYEFHRLDATHYTLCTVFATSYSLENGAYSVEGVEGAERWRHGVGRTCYKFDVTQTPLMPQRI